MSVFLSNLDDFISPSQACINPLVSSSISSKPTTASSKLTIQSDFSMSEFDVRSTKPSLIKSKPSSSSANHKVASVSLNDCLACSGCVTSAETVLIQEQSYDKLLVAMGDSTAVVVVQISPQSRSSLADALGLSNEAAFLYIAALLKSLGAGYVVDSSSGGDIALIEARDEFLERHLKGRSSLWSIPDCKSSSLSSSRITLMRPTAEAAGMSRVIGDPVVTAEEVFVGVPAPAEVGLPMLVSSCPGWICYAEKMQPQALPYIATGKSPQQVLGVLIKSVFRSAIVGAVQQGPISGGSISAGVFSQVGSEEGLIVRAEKRQNTRVSERDAASSETSHELTSATRSSSAGDQSPQPAKRIFVASVQPCFDKKLEASRRDFYHDGLQAQEVDLVLSTAEMWSLLEHLVSEALEVEAERGTVVEATGATASDVPQASSAVLDSPMRVRRYLTQLSPDPPQGRDWVEELLRCFSEEGQALVRATDANGGSGGYAEYVSRAAAESLLGLNLWDTPLTYVAGRNPDIAEVEISVATHSSTSSSSSSSISSISSTSLLASADESRSVKKLKFGRAYGFRNIQSIMLKMKRDKLDLDFIEVMACPSGCINGGGQIKTTTELKATAVGGGGGGGRGGGGGEVERVAVSTLSDSRETPAQTRERVERVGRLFHSGAAVRRPEQSPLVKFIYDGLAAGEWSREVDLIASTATTATTVGTVGTPNKANEHEPDQKERSKRAIRQLFHTRYHAVPKLEILAPLAARW